MHLLHLVFATLLVSAASLPEGAGPKASVGKIKLAPDGLETSRIGLGALHFPELESKYTIYLCVCQAAEVWARWMPIHCLAAEFRL